MEQVLFFTLGVLTVITLALIAGVVILQKQFINLRHSLEFLQKEVEHTERNIYDSLRGSENLSRELDVRIDEETRAVYEILNSRLEKLENRSSTKK